MPTPVQNMPRKVASRGSGNDSRSFGREKGTKQRKQGTCCGPLPTLGHDDRQVVWTGGRQLPLREEQEKAWAGGVLAPTGCVESDGDGTPDGKHVWKGKVRTA